LFQTFARCFIGTLIGHLPGLGPLATVSLLRPLTYSLRTVAGLTMFAGIYYGVQYGENVRPQRANWNKISAVVC
jgi:TctA family transporter